MGKMAIVGCEASGKTVFLSALVDLFRPDATHTPCLIPENQAANRFGAFQRRQMRALRQWPPATNPDKTVEMKWSLRLGGKILTEIGMLEFGGEIYRAAFRESDEEPTHKQAVKALLDFLEESDFVTVLVSIKELLRDPGNVSTEEFERDTESLWITRGLIDFVREHVPTAGLVIGLTQADRYRKELDDAGGAASLFEARWPSVRAAAPDVPVVEVASVSATDDEGRPAEGYETDGIRPVILELARQTYGTPSDIVLRLTEARQALDEAVVKDPGAPALANEVRRFGATIEALRAACALTGEDHASEADAFGQALIGLKETVKAKRKPPKKRKAKRKTPLVRKRFMAAFALALAVAAPLAILQYDGLRDRAIRYLGSNQDLKDRLVAACRTLLEAAAEPTAEPTVEPTDAPIAEVATNSAATVEAPVPGDRQEKPEPAGTEATEAPSVQAVEAPVSAPEPETPAPAAEPAEPSTNSSLTVSVATPREDDRARQFTTFSNRLARAEAGDVKCKRWLAHQYYGGSVVVESDLRKARSLYLEAAEGGDIRAMAYLGAMMANGEGGETDIPEARKWLRKAADGGAGKVIPELADWIRMTD